MPQLDVSTYFPQLFWLFISFILLYWLLSKLYLPKISKVFVDRDIQISALLKKAEENKAEAYRLKEEYESHFAQAVKEKNAAISKVVHDISQMIDSKIVEHDLHLKKLVDDSEKNLQDFKNKSMVDVRKIAIEATGEMVSSLLDLKLSSDLIKKSVEEQERENV